MGIHAVPAFGVECVDPAAPRWTFAALRIVATFECVDQCGENEAGRGQKQARHRREIVWETGTGFVECL